MLLLKSFVCVFGVLSLPCGISWIVPRTYLCVISTPRNASISVSSLDLCDRVTFILRGLLQTPQHSGLNSLGFILFLWSRTEINS